MIKIILTVGMLFLNQLVKTSSIYEISFIKIEGGEQQMSAFQGKKILIVTLPIQQTASSDSLLYSLDSLNTLHSSNLVIIGVPSIEDGYTDALKDNLKTWYRTKLANSIVISKGLRTRKSSGNQQHPLFKWITNKNFNGHFDYDVEGPGVKLFIWNDGELTSIMGSKSKLNSNLMKDLIEGQ